MPHQLEYLRQRRAGLPWRRVYLITVIVAAVAGFVGTEAVLSVLHVGKPGLRGLAIVPVSVITWACIVTYKVPLSLPYAVFAGAASPIVGCAVGTLYFGAGLIWLPFVVKYFYLFAPVGVITALVLRLCLSAYDRERRIAGSPAVPTKPVE